MSSQVAMPVHCGGKFGSPPLLGLFRQDAFVCVYVGTHVQVSARDGQGEGETDTVCERD